MEELNFRPEPFRGELVEPAAGTGGDGCGCVACRQREWEADTATLVRELDPAAATPQLVDIVTQRPSGTRSYGKPSSFKNPSTTSKRCVDGQARACPTLRGLEDVRQIAGVSFEYIGGGKNRKTKKPFSGIALDRTTNRYGVVEKYRLKNHTIKLLPRSGDGVATFLANMAVIGLPVEAILTMGAIYCRCIKNTNELSNHSYGDAIDIGGLRLVGGREVLVANSGLDQADRELLQRVNACLRLCFATVLDYHYQGHWDHFHCDTNRAGNRVFGAAWPFVRESLGLPLRGGFDKACANALRRFAGDPDAVKDRPALDRTLGELFMREAGRSEPALGSVGLPATRAAAPATAGGGTVAEAQRIAKQQVPGMPGTTIEDFVERWRVSICPEIPLSILIAFLSYESGGKFTDATHGSEKSGWTSPNFYELGLFQTPGGLHGRCTSRDCGSCEIPPPGREVPGNRSTWDRLCAAIKANPQHWKDPTTQVRVGLLDLELGARGLRKDFPDLFPQPGSDWDLRMAVLYRFSRGGGAARSFLRPYRRQLAAMPEDQRWSFLRGKTVSASGGVRAFKGENVEKKMALAARLGYTPA
jgi:hypothetical protein